MSNAFTDRQIALAGVCQAIYLVQKVARTGQCESQALEHCLKSILVTDSPTTEAIYGHRDNLKFGFECVVNLLGQSKQKDAELTRYIAGILSLERKLAQNSSALAELGSRITNLQRQAEHQHISESQVLFNVASIYSDVISPLGSKIQIAGDPNQLKITNNQHKVRALLLAAIRSAVLWRQLGGQRRQILFARTKIVQVAQEHLNHIN